MTTPSDSQTQFDQALRRALQEEIDDRRSHTTCMWCHKTVDPDRCRCGIRRTEHPSFDRCGHYFVAFGCVCWVQQSKP
jgi:hypothetical protein